MAILALFKHKGREMQGDSQQWSGANFQGYKGGKGGGGVRFVFISFVLFLRPSTPKDPLRNVTKCKRAVLSNCLENLH